MADYPAIMSGPMVLATLREIEKPGTGKTNTRRLAWQDFKEVAERDRAKLERAGCLFERRGGSMPGYGACFAARPSPWQKVKPGDRLWVKEAIALPHGPNAFDNFYYAADNAGVGNAVYAKLRAREKDRGKPYKNLGARYVPRLSTRITLIVTATKIERLWNISDHDCMAEGIVFETADPPFYYVPGLPHDLTGVGVEERSDLMPHAVQCFRKLWIHLHGREGWDANPEVVALTFRPVLANIDAPEAKAA